MTWEDAAKLSETTKAHGGRVVTTNGCFDILHRGHLSYLIASRAQGDLLLVGLNSDASIRKLKGADRPVNSEEDRALLLASLRFVDGVCVFDEDTPVAWLEVIKPQIHTKGADYKDKNIPEIAALKKWGGRMNFIELVDNYSTTALIQKLKGNS